jgi:hypothetical protein
MMEHFLPKGIICQETGIRPRGKSVLMTQELEKAVGYQVRVLNPNRLAIIYATDKKDAMKLAQLAADQSDSRLPVVAIPDDEDMEKRKLVSSYRREQQVRAAGINRLHTLFVHAGITTVVKKDLVTAEGRRETVRQVSGLEREGVEEVTTNRSFVDEADNATTITLGIFPLTCYPHL